MLDSHKPIQKPESLASNEEPLLRAGEFRLIQTKVNHEKLDQALKEIEKAWQELENMQPIEISLPDTSRSREAVEKASQTMNELIALYRKRQKR